MAYESLGQFLEVEVEPVDLVLLDLFLFDLLVELRVVCLVVVVLPEALVHSLNNSLVSRPPAVSPYHNLSNDHFEVILSRWIRCLHKAFVLGEIFTSNSGVIEHLDILNYWFHGNEQPPTRRVPATRHCVPASNFFQYSLAMCLKVAPIK